MKAQSTRVSSIWYASKDAFERENRLPLFSQEKPEVRACLENGDDGSIRTMLRGWNPQEMQKDENQYERAQKRSC